MLMAQIVNNFIEQKSDKNSSDDETTEEYDSDSSDIPTLVITKSKPKKLEDELDI